MLINSKLLFFCILFHSTYCVFLYENVFCCCCCKIIVKVREREYTNITYVETNEKKSLNNTNRITKFQANYSIFVF